MAISPRISWSGYYGYGSLEEAASKALNQCEESSDGVSCRLIMVDNLPVNDVDVATAVAKAKAARGGVDTMSTATPALELAKLTVAYRYDEAKDTTAIAEFAQRPTSSWDAARIASLYLRWGGQYQVSAQMGELALQRAEQDDDLSARNRSRVLYALGVAQIYVGNAQAGIDAIARAYALNPDDEALPGDMSWGMRRQGRYEEALKQADRALSAHPGYAYAEISKGYAYIFLGDEDAALAASVRAMGLAKSDHRRAQIHTLRSRIASHSGRYDDAVSLAREAVQTNESVWTQTRLAFALWLSGRGQEGVSLLRGLKESNHPEVMSALAEILAEMDQDLNEAERLARAAVAESEVPYMLNTLGFVLYKRGKLDEAEKYLREAYEKGNRANAFRAYSLGLVLDAKGDKQGAMALWREALTKHPSVHTRARIEASLAKQTASLH